MNKNKENVNMKAQNTNAVTTMACGKTCPTCKEPCVGGTHPGGQHGCSNGHSW